MRRVRDILCVAVFVVAAAPAAAAEPALAVIVHRDRADRMSLEELSNIYLKKRRFWDDGTPIVPLNRESGSPDREAFSRRVLGGTSTAYAGYWNEQYFGGVFPPATLSSSAAVKRYVAADRNAIGYIAMDEVDDTVRVVLRLR